MMFYGFSVEQITELVVSIVLLVISVVPFVVSPPCPRQAYVKLEVGDDTFLRPPRCRMSGNISLWFRVPIIFITIIYYYRLKYSWIFMELRINLHTVGERNPAPDGRCKKSPIKCTVLNYSVLPNSYQQVQVLRCFEALTSCRTYANIQWIFWVAPQGDWLVKLAWCTWLHFEPHTDREYFTWVWK